MIGNGSLAIIGAFLPEEAIAQLCTGDRLPHTAGALMPGRAIPVEGGYRVTGHWSWGSGVRHADWLAAQTLVVSSVSDLFVPEAFTFDSAALEPQRGGPLYRLGLPGLVLNEHVGFALGVGRGAPPAGPPARRWRQKAFLV
jgi:hypothetical protein